MTIDAQYLLPDAAVQREYERQFTYGSYATEDDAAHALDRILDQCNLWIVYREVCGALVHPRPAQEDKSLRIDRILVPTARLISLGWTHGVVGVEIKRSGVKIGPPIAQAMDYGRTAWMLAQLGGMRVWLDWIFIWPMPTQGKTVGSILAQNRIGSAFDTNYSLLQLKSGEYNLIRINRDGEIHIGKALNSGRKAGSR